MGRLQPKHRPVYIAFVACKSRYISSFLIISYHRSAGFLHKWWNPQQFNSPRLSEIV
ncbi:unnamed protein product [Chondrus crispus]|uniref:Uncharacterized protein n=1 Tax=Chondrus crispus TaxID=2769 RepID=R7QSQ4_CHOCR|nr:unnamed protein product [Chondrus crispus]CDF40531.1 unnamed protein product [Chondrus crispus]|eukprot:XP_005710825.1 unnamed protein product [Chondrus crispus]